MTELEIKKSNAAVLVVEDDVLVRMPIAAYLRRCGYRVIEAAGSSEALTVLNQLDLPVDVVLTDVELESGTGGFAVAKWVHENRPRTKIILAGTPRRAAEQAGELCAKGPHLKKPYDHALVETEIRNLLAVRQKLDPCETKLPSRT
ncbi:response regulator receiver protein [Hyphomicrobium denitrificans 1NES1]|uniref:Response regulator receiver protein n=1 Tax=Hyphomicrobium denitrificans 1NES1 TaxID=670307 RepID=N0B8H9_9HYPH|nr:response regulator [Hyphomicrobium denitrificans]AGK58532.1 response regulator receiver protein [Hyphomicrobium denitrificans 1NES1]